MLAALLSLLRGQSRPETVPQKRGQCRACQQRLPFNQLVYVNHCYHAQQVGPRRIDYAHRDCAGVRVLCQPCHNALPAEARDAFYAKCLAELGDAYPQEAEIGLRRGGTAGELGHAGYGVRASG